MNRLWSDTVDVTPELIRDPVAFEEALLSYKPREARASEIVRLHVRPSRRDGLINVTVIARESE